MRKKIIYLIIGLLALFSMNFLMSVKAETTVLYSIEGQITYKKDMLPPVYILYNFSIPIELQEGDVIYWHQKYNGECDVLDILIHWDYSGTHFDNFVYHKDAGYICENTKKYTIGGLGTINRSRIHVIIKKSYTNVDYSYHLTWQFWIERDIDTKPEPEGSNDKLIGIDLIPFITIISLVTIIPLIIMIKKEIKQIKS